MVRACRGVRSIGMWRRGRVWAGVLAGIAAFAVVPPAVAQSPPPPDVGSTGSLTGTPSPTALSPAAGDELTFSSHGFIRAPMRMGVGHRPSCPPGVAAGTLVTPGGSPLLSGVEPSAIPGAPPPKAAVFQEVQCAGAGQSNVDFHSPRLPDDQYLDPRYTRQWEKDWTEVFFNYGNSHIVGTVSFQAFGLSDAEHVSVDNLSSQLGIAQAWVTLTPTVDKLRLNWKVGAFWDKYGMSGKDDAGKYDMYLFGRTHLMGQTLGGEYPIGDVLVRASEGFGVKNEELEFTPVSYGFPGYTLVAHVHAGASYKKVLAVNVHYISAFAQDARVQGPAAISTQLPAATTGNLPDGHIDIAGVEARLSAGALGDLYLGYSHLSARQAEQVGPAIEPISSLGGYSGGTQNAALPGSSAAMVGSNYYGPNGIMDNYLGSCFRCAPQQIGTGSVDSLLAQYDLSLGALYRKIRNPAAGFWGDGPDVLLSLFGLYQAVSSTDTSGLFPLVGDGVRKLKYGADLVVNPVSWMGIGVRADYVQPTSLDAHESFGVVSPKIMFRSRYLAHEEITAQYSHYFFGADVLPQPPNGPAASFPLGTNWAVYAPDANVLGIKATMWW